MKKSARVFLVVLAVVIAVGGLGLGLHLASRERTPFDDFDTDQIHAVYLGPHNGNEIYRLSTKETAVFESLLRDFKVSGFSMNRTSDEVQHKIGDGASFWTFIVWYDHYEFVEYTGLGQFLFVNGTAYHADPYHQTAMLQFFRQVCADNGFDPDIC